MIVDCTRENQTTLICATRTILDKAITAWGSFVPDNDLVSKKFYMQKENSGNPGNKAEIQRLIITIMLIFSREA